MSILPYHKEGGGQLNERKRCGVLYLYEKNHKLSAAKKMRDTKLRAEQAKKRINELDGLISASFEQLTRGTISEE